MQRLLIFLRICLDSKGKVCYAVIIRLNDCLIVKLKGEILMKKTYKIEVDCANCAAKMEDACKKLPGIKSLQMNFMAQKMTVDFEDGQDVEAVLDQIEKTCKKVERGFELYR